VAEAEAEFIERHKTTSDDRKRGSGAEMTTEPMQEGVDYSVDRGVDSDQRQSTVSPLVSRGRHGRLVLALTPLIAPRYPLSRSSSARPSWSMVSWPARRYGACSTAGLLTVAGSAQAGTWSASPSWEWCGGFGVYARTRLNTFTCLLVRPPEGQCFIRLISRSCLYK